MGRSWIGSLIWDQSAAAGWDVGWWVEEWPPSLSVPSPAATPTLLSWRHIFFDHVFMVAHCAFSQCPCHWGGGLCVFHWAVTGKCSCFIKGLLFLTSPSIPFTCLFSSSSNTEEDTVLQTNKQIYSQLLRATANRNSTLLERIEVIICLLEQLASGSSGSSGGAVPWPKVVPEDLSVPSQPRAVLSTRCWVLLNMRRCHLNRSTVETRFPQQAEDVGCFGFFLWKVKNQNGTKSFPVYFLETHMVPPW